MISYFVIQPLPPVYAELERMVLRNAMTIQLPDDLARGLEEIAATQHKSVEQVAVESLRSVLDRPGSPAFILKAIREMPHVGAEDGDAIEAAISAGRLPVSDKGIFD